MVAIKASILLALLPLLAVADEAPGFTMDQNPGKLVPKLPSSAKDKDCLKVYKERHIECVPEVMHSITMGDPNEVPTEAQLKEVCTDTCLNSLRRWIRGSKDCGPDNFLKFLGISNSTTKEAGYKVSDLQQFFINDVYWDKCLVDLVKPQNGGSKYCVLQWEEIIAAETSHLPNQFLTSDPDDFCKDQTCGAQQGYLAAPKKTIRKIDNKGKSTDTPKTELVNLNDVCPKIDTKKFPEREESIKDSDLEEMAAEAEKAAKSEMGETDQKMASEKSSSTEGGEGKSSGAKPVTSTNGAQRSDIQTGFAVSALLVAVGALIL